jgi:peptidoglycan/LPS O-acetylase OafA/YrhL
MAVLAVLLFHGDVSWARGGFLGVSLFFTLSGFLITSLLLTEHGANGTVRLKAFWVRRARRLLPASLAALVLATVTIGIVIPVAQRSAAVTDVRAALLNVANWRFIFADQPYLETGQVPSPVTHYWSLSIEEQFYLFYPLLAFVALRWRMRGLAAVLGIMTVGSLVFQLRLDDPVRIYYGTHTRAAELAVGGLLACALVWRRSRGLRTRTIVADGMGAVALLVTILFWWSVPQDAGALYEGGLLAAALVWAVLIYAAVEGAGLARVVAAAPLRGLGLISYGVYLFHFPLYLLLTEDRIGVSGLPLLAVRLAATLAVALASYHLLELPIRRGGALPGRRAAIAALAGASVVLLVTVPVLQRAEDVVAAAPGAGSGITVLPAEAVPAEGIPRLVVVGDSTAGTFGEGLQTWGRESGRAEVAVVSNVGCAALLGERFRVRDGYEFVPEGCDQLLSTAADQARQLDADAIVVLLGSAQLADWQFEDRSGWHSVEEAEISADYRRALAEVLDQLESTGLPLLWADIPTPDWDVEAFADQLGTPLPGSGRVTLNDPDRAAAVNRLDAEIIAASSLGEIWSLRSVLDEAQAATADELRFDGLHIAPEHIPALVDAGLIDALQRAYESVVDRGPPGVSAPAALAWARS